LGEFFRHAKQKPWYSQTLFVITADHGPRIYGNSTIPVASYRVPVVFLAQGLGPRTHSSLGSIMDIPSTILDLLDVEDSEGFMGGTLFSATHGSALVEHDYHIGVVTQNDLHKTLTLVPPGAVAESWMLRDSMVDKKFPTDSDDAAALIGIFQSAREAFYKEVVEAKADAK
jgi:phosphoglycerol transferase MdoB-like AlkP superfamily enzyme